MLSDRIGLRRVLLMTTVIAGILADHAAAQVDRELTAYIASRRKVMDNAARPIAERESVAVEVAATLDRGAWNSG